MRSDIQLGSVFGIRIGLHFSWLFVALLIVFSLQSYLYGTNPQWGALLIWLSALCAGLLFFATLIAHELAHSIVAKSRGLAVRSITLFALGGVAEIEKEPSDAKTEFWIAVVGPISSLIIGILFLSLSLSLGWRPPATPSSPILAMLVWLGYINVTLAVFNLVPGFPLDGGRILKALVWWITGSVRRATAMASGAGQVVAMGIVLIGVFQFFRGGGFSALWLVFIGWFLIQAART